MIVKVVKEFKDKETKSILKPNIEINISEDRFSELTAGPIFVEKIIETSNDNIIFGLDLSNNKDITTINGEVIESHENDGEIDSIAFTKMKKEEIVKFAKDVMGIELNMDMTKAEMIELLEK